MEIRTLKIKGGSINIPYFPYSTNSADYCYSRDITIPNYSFINCIEGNRIYINDDLYFEEVRSDTTIDYRYILKLYYKGVLQESSGALNYSRSKQVAPPSFDMKGFNTGNVFFNGAFPVLFEDSNGDIYLSSYPSINFIAGTEKIDKGTEFTFPRYNGNFSTGNRYTAKDRIYFVSDSDYMSTFYGDLPGIYTNLVHYKFSLTVSKIISGNVLNPEPAHSEDTSDLNNIGGDGDDTNDSDDVDYPDDTATLNANNAVNAGFITLYNPTKGQLQNLASYLWTSDFVDNIKKLFGNPMDVIIGLNQVPVTVSSSTSQSVKAGFIDTGVTMNVCDAQYIEKDLGYFTQKLYWGSCLDFDPNTKVQIYLPFIGVRPLNVNDVMGTTLHLKYRIDILTGQCVAWLKCGTSVKYEWAGHCANTIPLTASNWSQIFQSAVGLAATVGTGIAVGVATGGASVPETIGLASSSLSQASNMKPTIERSGSMGGSASIMGMKKAFLIIQRPSTSLPKNYGKLYGYASNKTRQLSDLTGFTQVEHVNLSTSYATEEEYLEIVSMLKEGVIL